MITNAVSKALRMANARLRFRPFSAIKELNDDSAERRIMRLLDGLPDTQTGVVLRDIHVILGTSQSRVLRAVRSLEEKGDVEVDVVQHDPLASRVSITRR